MSRRIFTSMLMFLLLSMGAIFAQTDPAHTVDMHIFYGKGCPHCAQLIEHLDSIEESHPYLRIHEHEVYFNQKERELFAQTCKNFNTQIEGVPTTFIDSKVFVGFNQEIGDKIEGEIKRCASEGCSDPLAFTHGSVEDEKSNTSQKKDIEKISGEYSDSNNPQATAMGDTITIGAVISAAAVDAINPCAFAVLIILMTTILSTGDKNKALLSGLAFSTSIFISYLLMGLGLYQAISITGLSHTFYTIVAILAIFVGLFNLKDYFAYGKWFVMEVPLSWRPKMKSLIKGVTSVPGAFLVGFAVSLFLLPCTSGPYIVILGLLTKVATQSYAFLLLVLYNLIFILPMIIITLAIHFGLTTTEKAEHWRSKKLRVLHLIAGLIILSLGIGMLIAMHLGWM